MDGENEDTFFGSSVFDDNAEASPEATEAAPAEMNAEADVPPLADEEQAEQVGAGEKRSRSPEHDLRREPSRQPSAEGARDEAAANEAMDNAKELAYYKDELNKVSIEKMLLQKQLASARTQSQTAHTTVTALEARCAALESAAAAATTQFGAALGTAFTADASAEPIDRSVATDSASLAFAQTALLRLESTTRENIVLRQSYLASEAAAIAWKREAHLWKSVAESASAASRSQPAVASTTDNAAMSPARLAVKQDSGLEPILAAGNRAAQEVLDKFDMLLTGACSLLEDSAATAAAEGDWKKVVANLSQITRDVLRAHKEQLSDSAKARAKAEVFEKCATENALRAHAAANAAVSASLPLAALRCQLAAQDAPMSTPVEAANSMDVAATPLLRAALAALTAPTANGDTVAPSQQETLFLRFAARELRDKVHQQEATIRSLTQSLSKLSDWSLRASRGAQPHIGVALDALRDASDVGATRGNGHSAVLEQLCSMWAMRAVSAVNLAADRSTSALETQVHRLQAAVAGLEAQLRVERTSNIALRTHVAVLLRVEAANQSADSNAAAADHTQTAKEAATAYDDAVTRLVQALNEHATRLDKVISTREGHLTRTVAFLRHALHAADRAIVAMIPAQLGDAPRPSALLEALKKKSPVAQPPSEQAPTPSPADTARAVDAAVEQRFNELKAQFESDLKIATASARQEVASLTRKLNVFQALDRNAAASRCLDLEQQLGTSVEDAVACRAQIASLKKSLEALEVERSALAAKLEVAVHKNGQLTTQCATSRSELAQLQVLSAAAETDLRKQIADVTERLTEATAEIDSLKQQVASFEATAAATRALEGTPEPQDGPAAADEAADNSVFTSPFGTYEEDENNGDGENEAALASAPAAVETSKPVTAAPTPAHVPQDPVADVAPLDGDGDDVQEEEARAAEDEADADIAEEVDGIAEDNEGAEEAQQEDSNSGDDAAPDAAEEEAETADLEAAGVAAAAAEEADAPLDDEDRAPTGQSVDEDEVFGTSIFE